jgi:hypothetical protein
MADKPTLYINDRLSADLGRYQASMHPSNTWRRKMDWWIPWAKDLEFELAKARHERDQLKALVEELKKQLNVK